VPVTPPLSEILRCALTKDPRGRFQTAEQFAAAVRASLAGDGVAEDAERTVIALPRTGQTIEASFPGTVGAINATGRAASAGWKPETLQAVETQLAKSLGPMARILVKQAAQGCDNLAALYDRLGQHIHNDAERSAFLTHRATLAGETRHAATEIPAATIMGTSGAGVIKDSSVASPMTREQITAAEQALTQYLGPIARVLVKQTLAKTNSRQEFVALLADHIPREEDRAAFRRKLP
jgi:serine/threonine-protein kinase